MTNTFYGADAVAQVEAAEGPLSPIERRIVELEGFSTAPYQDTKGITTTGVGQTGQYAGMSFKDTAADFVNQARSMIPQFDTLPEGLQTELVQAAYRGDLQQSPKTVALINDGQYNQAAQEFLDNDEYRTTAHGGIRQRMEDVSGMLQAQGRRQDQQASQAVTTQDLPQQPTDNSGNTNLSSKKQEQMAQVSENKQEAIAKASEKKKNILGGLSQEQAEALEVGRYDFLSNGNPEEFEARAAFYNQAEAAQSNAIKAAKEASKNNDAIFDSDTTLGYVGNTALSTVNTAAKIVGGLAAAPSTILGSLGMQGVEQEDLRMYESIVAKANKGETFTAEESEWMEKQHPTQNTTMFSRIDDAMTRLDLSDTISESAGFLGKYVDTNLTEEFVQEGSDIFKQLSDGNISAGEFASQSAQLLMDSPGALGQTTVESLPYIISSAYNLPLTIMSGFADKHNEALEAYEKEHGEKPTGEAFAKLTGLSLASATADHLGDRIVSGGAASLTKSFEALIGKAAAARIAKSPLTVAGRVAEGTAGEFVAEGSAELLSQAAVQGDIDYGTAYASALLGAGSGGITAGAIDTPQLVGQAAEAASKVAKSDTVKKATDTVKKAADSTARTSRKTYNEAVKEGDTAKLPKKGDTGFNVAEDLRARTAIIQSQDLEGEQAKAVRAEGRANLVALQGELVAAKKAADEGNPTQTQEQADVMIAEFQQAREAFTALSATRKTSNVSQQADALATAKNTENAQQAVTNVMGSIDLEPTSITFQQSEAILNNKNLNLTPEQTKKLTDHVEVYKALDTVSNEVRSGGNGNIGITDYLTMIPAALAEGETQQATDLLNQFKAWREQQFAKTQTTTNPKTGRPHSQRFLRTINEELGAMDTAIAKLEGDISGTPVTQVEAPAETTTQVPVQEQPVVTPANQGIYSEEGATAELTAAANRLSPDGESRNLLRDVFKAIGQGRQNDADIFFDYAGYPEMIQAIGTEQGYAQGDIDIALGALNENQNVNQGALFPEDTTEQTVTVPTSNVVQEAQAEVADLNETLQEPTTEAVQQADEAVAEEAPVVQAEEQAPQQTETEQAVTEELSGLEDAPNVNQTVAKVFDLMSEGATTDGAVEAIRSQYGNDVANATAVALESQLKGEQESLGTQLTKQEGETKVPVAPEGLKGKDLNAFVRGYNWVKAYFNGRAEQNGVKSNILQTHPELFTDLQLVPTKLANHLGRPLTTFEVENVREYLRNRKRFDAALNKEIDTTNQFKDKDPILYLLEDGKFPENVKDAIYVNLYNWLATNAGDTLYNDAASIRGMLGLGKDDRVSKEAWDALGRVGSGRTSVVDSLGKDILRTLNIKATKDAPINVEPRMIQSLGLAALQVLDSAGYVTQSKQDAALMSKLSNSTDGTIDFANPIFIKAAFQTNEDGHDQLTPQNQKIKDSMRESDKSRPKGAAKLWEGLFRTESGNKAPSTVAPKEVALKQKGTDKLIPASARKILAKHQKRKHFIKQNSLDAFRALDRDAALRMMGWKDLGAVHVDNQARQQGMNDSYERSYDNMAEFADDLTANEGIDSPFYFTHVMWRNGRIGIDENMVNPQSNKHQRAFIAQEGWPVDINLNDTKLMSQFWAAMDEPLGLDSLEQLSNKPDLIEAVQIIQQYLENGDFQDQADLRLADIFESEGLGDGTLAFDALTNLARYFTALEDGADTFNADIALEIDGKTNGVIIGMLQYAGAQDSDALLKALNKGGFFGEGDATTINQFEGKDAYQEIAFDWVKIVEQVLDNQNVSPAESRALTMMLELYGLIDTTVDDEGNVLNVFNKKALRNLAKNPLMVTTYGSGAKSVTRALGDELISKVYNAIETAHALPEGEREFAMRNILNQVNTIAPGAFDASKPLMEQTFGPKAEASLRKLVEEQFGTPVNEVIGERYKTYMDNRGAVVDVYDNMFRLYSVARDHAIEQAYNEGIADGTIAKGVTHISQETMNAIEERLAPIAPHMDSYFSKSDEGVASSLDLNKSSTRRAEKGDVGANAFVIEAKYASGNRSVAATVTAPVEPGVGPGVVSVHAQDAADILSTYESDMDSLGVHDANYWGLVDAEAGGQLQNQALLDVMKDMSIPEEALKAYARANQAFKQYVADSGADGGLLGNKALAITTGAKKESISRLEFGDRVKVLTTVARDAKAIKDETLAKTKSVHQYADHNGVSAISNGNPTDATDSAKAAEEAILGSADTAQADTNPMNYDSDAVVDSTNATSVFDQLPNTGGKQENKVHKANLREMVQELTSKMLNPFTLYMRSKPDTANFGIATDSDIFITNQVQGAPTTSSMLARGILMSNEEVMAHELNHLVYAEGFNHDTTAKRAIERLFLAAREQLDYTALLNDPAIATPSEIEGAQATWNHMITNRQGNHLAEFAAFASTNENLGKAINNVQVTPEKVFAGNPYQILQNVLKYLVEAFSDRIQGTLNVSNDKKLAALLDNMVRVGAKKRKGILNIAEEQYNLAAGVMYMPAAAATKAVQKLAATKWLSGNKYSAVSTPARIVAGKLAPSTASKSAMSTLNSLRDIQTGNKYGIVQSVMDEVLGRTLDNASIRDLARKSNLMVDQQRKRTKEAMVKSIRDSFQTPVSDAQWTALNKVLLKLDVDAIGHLGTEKLAQLLTDPVQLETEIKTLEQSTRNFNYRNFYLRQAKNLGYFMITGRSREAVTLLNAHNIARMYGDLDNNVSEIVANRAEPIINQLATLYGLRDADSRQKIEVATLLNAEMTADSTNNGITSMLTAHNALKTEARAQFTSDLEYKSLFVKGFTKETYKEGAGLEIATADKHEELVNQGYIRGEKVARDPNDPVREDMWMYVAPDGALSPYMSTIASLTSNIAKGSDTYKVNTQTGAESPRVSGLVDSSILTKSARSSYDHMHLTPNGPTGASKYNYMVPIMSPNGHITGWRYMMSESNKDNLLGKENHAAEVLGSMAGNITDKLNSAKINRELVEVAKAQYDEDFSRRSSSYVTISPDSADSRLRETYAMLPDQMKQDIREVWGSAGMQVRKDLVVPMFGYRKYSLTEMFQKDPESRRVWEALAVTAVRSIAGDKAAVAVRRAENIMQAITQEIKDIVVVKSVVITMANMLSNSMFLVMNGMTPLEAMKKQYTAFQKSNELIKDQGTIDQLQLELDTKTLNAGQIRNRQAEIARIQRNMQGNPVLGAFQAGLMPTIVQDVEANTEFTNTVRGKAQKDVSNFIDNKLGFLPSWGRDTVKGVAGLPDSTQYRILNNLVMQSDFIARYAILEHWSAEQAKAQGRPLTAAQTNYFVGEAEELFVNFDAPTHKGIQYMNDIGLAWFSKYRLRTQRAVARTFAANPLRVATSMMGMELSGIDSQWDTPIGGTVFGGTNPLSVIDSPINKALNLSDLGMNMHISGSL